MYKVGELRKTKQNGARQVSEKAEECKGLTTSRGYVVWGAGNTWMERQEGHRRSMQMVSGAVVDLSKVDAGLPEKQRISVLHNDKGHAYTPLNVLVVFELGIHQIPVPQIK
ncbi:hypothetical protein B0H14DRAFT_2601593 [Mycena olivaceomarginata]|nr:hypothetical protein B0H14DRAFT_2601593 [Mycena olivaceomarginata]